MSSPEVPDDPSPWLSGPQRCDKGLWPMAIKLKSPDHLHLGFFQKKKKKEEVRKESKTWPQCKPVTFFTRFCGDIDPH